MYQNVVEALSLRVFVTNAILCDRFHLSESKTKCSKFSPSCMSQLWPQPLALRCKPINPYFHYGCALRCVAREIETLSAQSLSPRKATQHNAQPQWK